MSCATVELFSPGELVFRVGDPPDKVYVVCSGSLLSFTYGKQDLINFGLENASQPRSSPKATLFHGNSIDLGGLSSSSSAVSADTPVVPIPSPASNRAKECLFSSATSLVHSHLETPTKLPFSVPNSDLSTAPIPVPLRPVQPSNEPEAGSASPRDGMHWLLQAPQSSIRMQSSQSFRRKHHGCARFEGEKVFTLRALATISSWTSKAIVRSSARVSSGQYLVLDPIAETDLCADASSMQSPGSPDSRASPMNPSSPPWTGMTPGGLLLRNVEKEPKNKNMCKSLGLARHRAAMYRGSAQRMLKRGKSFTGELCILRDCEGIAKEKWYREIVCAEESGLLSCECRDGGSKYLGNARQCERVEAIRLGSKKHVIRVQWHNGSSTFLSADTHQESRQWLQVLLTFRAGDDDYISQYVSTLLHDATFEAGHVCGQGGQHASKYFPANVATRDSTVLCRERARVLSIKLADYIQIVRGEPAWSLSRILEALRLSAPLHHFRATDLLLLADMAHPIEVPTRFIFFRHLLQCIATNFFVPCALHLLVELMPVFVCDKHIKCLILNSTDPSFRPNLLDACCAKNILRF